ncbi:hypothetical protein QI554_29905 [Yinghuangia seranimata]|nr:hypothetical protein [Yinghuangia seranimata]MDI2130368.1 hypothetical protein [Yinghuangia seranimata]
MNHDGGGERLRITCPHCLDPVAYDESALYEITGKGEHKPLDISREFNPKRRDDTLRRAYQRCPDTGGVGTHYLPVPYLRHGPGLTIAMVGGSSAGKTHLLTAMVSAVDGGDLDAFGIKWRSANPEWHRRFLDDAILPLRRGATLRRTDPLGGDGVVEFADALLLTGPRGQRRSVTFFDLAGEDLVTDSRTTTFLVGVDALIFVVDPLTAFNLPQLDEPRKRAGVPGTLTADPAFASILDRMPQADGALDAAVAVVVNKCDLMPYEPPVDRWLWEEDGTVLDPVMRHAENRDVYAFLHRHAEPSWLRPVKDARRCSLHFVSTTGAPPGPDTSDGIRPRRVLEPLLSVFGMCGLIDGSPSAAGGG